MDVLLANEVHSQVLLHVLALLVHAMQTLLRDAELLQTVVRSLRGEEVDVHVRQRLQTLLELVEIVLRNADQKVTWTLVVLAEELEVEVRREQRLQERLAHRLTVARHLSRRCHLHARRRIRAAQTREREHGRLAAHVVQVTQHDVAALVRKTHHHARRQLDEVEVERLRDERERA